MLKTPEQFAAEGRRRQERMEDLWRQQAREKSERQRFLAGAYLFHRENKKNREAQQAAADNLLRATSPEVWEQVQLEREARQGEAGLGGALWILILIVAAIAAALHFISPAPASAPASAIAPASASSSAPASASSSAIAPAPAASAPAVVPLNVVLPVLADAPLREDPDGVSKVIEQIHAGQRVRVVGEVCDASSDCYFEIRKLNGVVGFAASRVIAE